MGLMDENGFCWLSRQSFRLISPSTGQGMMEMPRISFTRRSMKSSFVRLRRMARLTMAGETERSVAVFRSPLPSQAVASFSIQSGSGTPQAASAFSRFVIRRPSP